MRGVRSANRPGAPAGSHGADLTAKFGSDPEGLTGLAAPGADPTLVDRGLPKGTTTMAKAVVKPIAERNLDTPLEF
jgi:hypothetical protein